MNNLINHIIAMCDDPYLNEHPEWVEIVKEAKECIQCDNDVASNIFKISQTEYHMFMKLWGSGDKYRNQRMGQAFYNEYCPHYHIPSTDQLLVLNKLFYCENDIDAHTMIINNFVRW
jgi:hypothetical protein